MRLFKLIGSIFCVKKSTTGRHRPNHIDHVKDDYRPYSLTLELTNRTYSGAKRREQPDAVDSEPELVDDNYFSLVRPYIYFCERNQIAYVV